MASVTETSCDTKDQFKALTQAVFRLNSLLSVERDRLVEDLGLTSARWQVLEALAAQSEPVSAATLARHLYISRQAVQRVLNDLALRELIILTASDGDRRAQVALLTPTGNALAMELDRRLDVLRSRIANEHKALVADFIERANTQGLDQGQIASPGNAVVREERTAGDAGGLLRRSVDPTSGARTFEIVRDRIFDEIADGRLQSGDRLPPERDLATELGVGRSAVREALRSLEMTGVLRFKRGADGGAFVRESSSEGIESSIRSMLVLGRLPLTDLLEVRASLLGQCARLGATRATGQDFARLERNVDELEHCIKTYNNQALAIEPATEFYRLAARASHNRLMILLVDAIAGLVAEMLTELKHRPPLDSVTARREMIAAMREGRADDAARVIRMHSYDTNRLLLRSKRNFPKRN